MNKKRIKKERRSKKRKLIVILLIISIIFCLIKNFSKKEQETISQENSKDAEITVADITAVSYTHLTLPTNCT